MALYNLPPNPSGAELAGICDQALAKAQAARDLLGGAAEFSLVEKATGALARLFQADYNAGANRQLDTAIALLRQCRDEAAAIGAQAAGGELTAKVRQACITIEQEAGGAGAITANNVENRATLADDLSDPGAYVGAGLGLAGAPASLINQPQYRPDVPELPKNPLAGLKTWVYVAGGLLLLAIVVGIYFRVRGRA